MTFDLCQPRESLTLEYKELTTNIGVLELGPYSFLFRRGNRFITLSEEERAFLEKKLEEPFKQLSYRPMTAELQHAILATVRDALQHGRQVFDYEFVEEKREVLDEHFR